jgi:thioredoxin reductase (NADPH)
MTLHDPYDLAIIGGGPAGLSAAINAASEGLSVQLLDKAAVLGGQARESAAIENYAGFPEGITGQALMDRLVAQTVKFRAGLAVPCQAVELTRADATLWHVVDDYGDTIRARAVLLSPGLAYRRLSALNLGQFMGSGAYYGVPGGKAPTRKCDVCVVGGANSAGQAVLNLARNSSATVRLVVRHQLADQMSQYLIDRIRATTNIEVIENATVTECHGGLRGLSEVCIDFSDKSSIRVPTDYLYIYIGAVPRTYWLGAVQLDPKGFIRTWDDVDDPGAENYGPENFPYETSAPGVFAAGDCRLGSVKRIAAAVGEGAAAVQFIHRRLGDQ